MAVSTPSEAPAVPLAAAPVAKAVGKPLGGVAGWRGMHPGVMAAGFVVLFGALVAALNIATLPALQISEDIAADWIATLSQPETPPLPLSKPAELPHHQLVVLKITEDTLSHFPFRSPIDRHFLADTLDLLAARKVKAVGFDVLFDQPTVAEADAAFQAAVRRFPAPVVVGWTDRATNLTERQYAFEKEYLKDIRAGFVNMAKDRSDGTVREAFPGREEDGIWRTSLAGALAEAVGQAAPREPYRIRYLKGSQQDPTTAFATFPIEALKVLPPAWFNDRVVLVGVDLPHDDRHRTPFAAVLGNEMGTIAGLQIQAQILGHLLDAAVPKARNYPTEVLIVLALAGGALLLAAWERGVVVQGLAGLAVIALLWAGAVVLYLKANIVLPVVVPSLVFGIGLFAAVAYIGHLRRLEGQFVRDAFSHYVSPAVLTDVESSGLQLGGEKREISVLFTDIEGFTTFAERQEPTVLIGVVNRYLTVMTDAVDRHGGMVDKFIGDAVMAVFGAPIVQTDHAQQAIDCALAMRDASERLRAELHQDGFELGRTRIGVHSGYAVVGNVGGERKFNYTAVGDVVNTASRLEGANKHFGTQICISADTCKLADYGQVRPIGGLVVKGRTEGLPVVTPVTPEEGEQTASYRAAYQLMQKGDLDALGAFVEHCRKWPQDALAAFHLTRLKTFKIDDRIVLEGK